MTAAVRHTALEQIGWFVSGVFGFGIDNFSVRQGTREVRSPKTGGRR